MSRIIGIETAILQRSLTGVGNYLYHLVRALAAQGPEVRFRGLGLFGWHEVDDHFLRDIGGLHQRKQHDPTVPLRQAVVRNHTLHKLYHKICALQFMASSKFQGLDLFHAFNYVPPSNPGVPVLPVVYDLSFIRMPETHPRERLMQLERLPKIISRAKQVHTISEFSRREISSVFGYPLENIFVASPAASKIFRPLGTQTTERQLSPFDLKHSRYFLSVGTLEPRRIFER